MEREIFPSWSDAFDERFGVYNVEDGLPVPYYLKNALFYLTMVWAGLYFAIAILSSFFIGNYTGDGCPRVAVAFGCLYRGVDRWFNVLPRMITCTYLHYTLMHILMNSYSMGGSYALLTNSPMIGSQVWIYYWVVPVWAICSVFGSVLTYCGHLKRVSSFSVGASGGACGFSVFSTILVFTLAPSSLSTESRDTQMLSLLQTLVMVGVQSSPLATLGTGKKVDWMAHLGGALSGVFFALLVQHMVEAWDEVSFLRLGGTLTMVCLIAAAAAFFAVILQYCHGHQERVVRCYIQWIELDKIALDEAQQTQRRWTLGHDRMIEQLLNKYPRSPRAPLSQAHQAEEDEWLSWRAHKQDDEILYFDNRGTI